MTAKTTGAEFKRFYADKEFWPDNSAVYHEYECITVDGADLPSHVDIDKIPDGANVTVAHGCIIGLSDGDEPSFEAYFKRWRKKQTTVSFVVECGIDKHEALVALIKANSGKVV